MASCKWYVVETSKPKTKDASTQLAVWRNGGGSPHELAVVNLNICAPHNFHWKPPLRCCVQVARSAVEVEKAVKN
jgi:hypothetical protein